MALEISMLVFVRIDRSWWAMVDNPLLWKPAGGSPHLRDVHRSNYCRQQRNVGWYIAVYK